MEMKPRTTTAENAWLSVGALLLTAVLVLHSTPVLRAEEPTYVQGEVILAFAHAVPESTKAAIFDDLGATVLHYWAFIDAYHLSLANKSVDQAIGEYTNDPALRYIEPNYYGVGYATVPNDIRFGDQWALDNHGQSGGTPDADIDAPEAWALYTDAAEIIVAILDTGVAGSHEDLQASLVAGWDYLEDDAVPEDDWGHGTHMAGTVGAVTNNGLGVAGVAWDVKIMPLRFYNNFIPPTLDLAVSAIGGAIASGAGIMVIAWGVRRDAQPLRDAMAEADSEGIISVVSAGNEGWDLDPPSTRRLFPQCYEFPSIICVAASDDDDVRWTTGVQSSNVGASSVDLAAPGAEILSTCIESEGHYCVKSGTSMAAPHVAGALALVMASNPWLTPLEARQQLLTNVDPVAAWQGLTVTGGGYGQVLCMTPSRSGLLHHAVDELHALDDLTQEFVTIELPPVALRASA